MSKIFDPLGWIVPVITKLKILFQETWLSNLPWDEQVPEKISKEWIKIKKELESINQFKIPRWYGTETASSVELHGFCDASTKAYACVIYCRIINSNKSAILVAAKSKLVPTKKQVSLPRLELYGALLLAKLTTKVKQCLAGHDLHIFAWSDSTAVLGWLQGNPSRWKTFVANRTVQITDSIPPQSWQYVKSSENPADCGSRGLTVAQLNDHCLWWQGPTWLQSFEATKEDQAIYTTNEEIKKQEDVHVVTKHEPSIITDLLSKYQSISKISRILALVMKITTYKRKAKKHYISLSEISQAKQKIIKQVQQEEFAKEIRDLKQEGKLSSKSKLLKLNPYLDENDILRVGGRLKKAHISHDMQHPIILPHSGRLTELIIEDAHRTMLHAGARLTLSFIRQKYWILGGNVATKRQLRRCVTCKKQNPDCQQQIMGHVCVVTVKTKNGTLKRPITKLSKLLVHNEPSQIKQVNAAGSGDSNTNKQSETRKVGTRYNIESVFTAIMLFFSIITTSQCALNVTQFRNNQHIYFDKLTNMQIIRDYWKLIIYYDLDPYWQGITALNKSIMSLEQSCRTIKEQTHCDIILLQLRHGSNELDYNNHMLLSQHFAKQANRWRRGLIDGVGYIANGLFGVLDARFAEQYEKDITLLRKNEKHIVSFWQNQTSVIEAEFSLLKRTEATMHKQHKMIHQQFANIENTLEILKAETQNLSRASEVSMGAIVASNLLRDLKDLQNALVDTITDTYHGRFNPHLITPEQLQDQLSTIASHLSNDVTLPVENIHTDLAQLVKLLRVKARMLKNYSIFEVQIPLISRDTYEIFKLIPIPVEKPKNTMLSIKPVSDFIAVNLKKDAYIILAENIIRSCLVPNVHLCYIHSPIYKLSRDKDFCQSKASACEVNVNPCKNLWVESHSINNYIYFCCGQCNLRTVCGDQVTAHQLTHSGLITIDYGCIIKSDNFEVIAHQQRTSDVSISANLYSPVIASINHVINVSIPQDVLNDSSIESDRELKTFEDKIKIMKENGLLFDSLSSHDIHHYTAIYCMIGVIAACLGVFVWRRARLRCAPTPAPTTRAADGAPGGSACPATQNACVGDSVVFQCDNERAKVVTSARVLDKATSPMLGSYKSISNL